MENYKLVHRYRSQKHRAELSLARSPKMETPIKPSHLRSSSAQLPATLPATNLHLLYLGNVTCLQIWKDHNVIVENKSNFLASPQNLSLKFYFILNNAHL